MLLVVKNIEGRIKEPPRRANLVRAVRIGIKRTSEENPLMFWVRKKYYRLVNRLSSIDTFDGLLVKYATRQKARAILRGLRAVTDFEYEFQLAMMNRRLEPELETVFLMTGLRWVFLSSSILKEAAVHGGDIAGMVPEIVFLKLREKFGLT